MPSAVPALLYVEDEPDDVFFMRLAFRRAGFAGELKVVEDGERAITYLAGDPPFNDRSAHPLPALVLLDLNLPLRSGFEVLEWIRCRAQFQGLPVVVFSSSGRPEDRVRAEQLGATGYMLKPTSGVEFADVALGLKQTWAAALS